MSNIVELYPPTYPDEAATEIQKWVAISKDAVAFSVGEIKAASTIERLVYVYVEFLGTWRSTNLVPIVWLSGKHTRASQRLLFCIEQIEEMLKVEPWGFLPDFEETRRVARVNLNAISALMDVAEMRACELAAEPTSRRRL